MKGTLEMWVRISEKENLVIYRFEVFLAAVTSRPDKAERSNSQIISHSLICINVAIIRWAALATSFPREPSSRSRVHSRWDMPCGDKPHRRVNFLNLDIRIVLTLIPSCSVKLEFGVYRIPGNAFSYLPYGSYHQRHIFRGWLKAEVYRLLTHCSNAEIWIEECRKFYDHLRRRGYPAHAIRSTFRAVSWNQRPDLLKSKTQGKKESNDQFFAEFRGCVFSTRNAPGCNQLREHMNLSLEPLKMSSVGDIFPSRALFSVKSALPLGYALRR